MKELAEKSPTKSKPVKPAPECHPHKHFDEG